MFVFCWNSALERRRVGTGGAKAVLCPSAVTEQSVVKWDPEGSEGLPAAGGCSSRWLACL